MEFEEAHINLCAIRLLYRLLEDNTLHDANSENVVEKARVLLKSLLDVAVELVFETHLKVTATQAGMKRETLCGLVGEEKDMMQQNLVKMTNQSNEKGILPNVESDNYEHQQMFDAKAGKSNEEDNTPLRNDICEAECNSSACVVESLEQKDDFADDLVSAIKRIESRILAFQLSSNLMDATKNGACHHPLHKASNLGSPEIQRKNRAVGSHLCCRKSLLERHRIVNQKTDKSSRKGENLISANAFEKPFTTRNESSSQNGLHANDESARSVYIPKHIGTQMVLGGEELRRGTWIQPSAQNMSMIDRVKSLNRLVSGDANMVSQASESIQGLRVPLNQNDLTMKKPSMFACQPNRERLVRNSPAAWSKTNQNQKGIKCESSHTQKLEKSTLGRREKPLPHHRVIKPTLLDQRSSEIRVNSHRHRDRSVLDRRGTHKTSHVETQKTRARPQPREPEESSSTPDSSSQWTSQQGSANSSNSDFEDSSMAAGTQGPTSGWMVNAAYEGSSKESSNSTQGPTPRWISNAAYEGSSEESSNSYLYKDDSPSHRAGSLKSYRHNGQRSPKKTNGTLKRLKKRVAYEGSSKESSNSTQGPTPRWIGNAAYEGSSEESSNSYLYKDDSPSHRAGSLKSYRHNGQRSPKKTNGTLKRLKNKLGLIFHHQHHHHHHHHDEAHGHSMWNNLQNVFHHKNKHGMLTNKKVEKTRRGAITKVLPRSNQVGQFHRLVEGLVTHIRHSKKPKPSKHGRMKGSRITPHGHGQKKLHWWKILRRHRGVKLKNRGRVKMGFISQK